MPMNKHSSIERLERINRNIHLLAQEIPFLDRCAAISSQAIRSRQYIIAQTLPQDLRRLLKST